MGTMAQLRTVGAKGQEAEREVEGWSYQLREERHGLLLLRL